MQVFLVFRSIFDCGIEPWSLVLFKEGKVGVVHLAELRGVIHAVEKEVGEPFFFADKAGAHRCLVVGRPIIVGKVQLLVQRDESSLEVVAKAFLPLV